MRYEASIPSPERLNANVPLQDMCRVNNVRLTSGRQTLKIALPGISFVVSVVYSGPASICNEWILVGVGNGMCMKLIAA